ncbi:hypothetical protein SeMB42_g05041 [Synchytrium endobioticum]|uniref:Uncharacterized protein n=1 Tax=Synchytrium endobioticum TaxID=286115 RepID=A0A507CUB8_9FUNG|nr:hypothetical protein SeMB42_g05041 [Synchytrium endobioticum]
MTLNRDPKQRHPQSFRNLMAVLKREQPLFVQERDPWFKWHGSVIPKTLPFVIAFTIFSVAVAVLQEIVWEPLQLPSVFVPVVSFVVGLLLVFRTNSAYDRYYEGRRLWSTLTATVRSAARTIWILAPEETPMDKVQKRAVMKLLIAYAFATVRIMTLSSAPMKRHLRGEHGSHWEDVRPHLVGLPQLIVESKDEALHLPNAATPEYTRKSSFSLPCLAQNTSRPQIIQNILDEEKAAAANVQSDRQNTFESLRRKFTGTPSIKSSTAIIHRHDYSCGCQNLPMEIANMLTAFVFEKRKPGSSGNDQLHFMTRDALFKMISALIETNASFERIITTPIPLAYNLHLKHTLLVYCFTLPFQLLSLGWAMIPAVALATAILWGIEHIGAEIENPFNYDPNDLPLEAYCEIVEADIEFMIARAPPKAADWMEVSDQILGTEPSSATYLGNGFLSANGISSNGSIDSAHSSSATSPLIINVFPDVSSGAEPDKVTEVRKAE